MTTYTAYKRYTNLDDYLNGPELERIFEGYINTEKKYARAWKGVEFQFALVVRVDPEFNYGQPFKVFKFFTANGRKMVQDVGIGSMISSYSSNVVLFKNAKETDDTFTITDIPWPKTAEARKLHKESGFWII